MIIKLVAGVHSDCRCTLPGRRARAPPSTAIPESAADNVRADQRARSMHEGHGDLVRSAVPVQPPPAGPAAAVGDVAERLDVAEDQRAVGAVPAAERSASQWQ
jgi:hypothetical protein